MKRYALDHLELRGHSYHARLNVPRDVQSALKTSQGKPRKRFRVALDTRDYDVAKRRAAEWVARWQPLIDAARGNTSKTDDAAYWAKALRTADDAAIPRSAGHRFNPNEPRTMREAVMEQISDRADAIGYETNETGRPPSASPEAQAFYAEATGLTVAPAKTNAHLEKYLDTKAGRQGAKSIRMDRIAIRDFAAAFPTIDAVTPKALQLWIDAEAQKKTVATINRALSVVRRYWTYLTSVEAVADGNDPLRKLIVPKKDKGAKQERQPFEPAEIVRLLKAATAKGDDDLADLIRLGMYTGCRLEELASLKVEHVGENSFTVREANELLGAKSKAGLREVPIHSALAQTMARLIDGRKKGYVLAGLKVNEEGDRGRTIGSRFGELKKAQGFGPDKVFHSIRKTVALQMLKHPTAPVPEFIVNEILGWENKGMAHHYASSTSTLAVKAEALAKVTYPE